MLPTKFTLEDAIRANEEWGANCGPGALAAITGKTLEEVRPHIPGFDAKRYTNAIMMIDALRSLRIPFNKMGNAWPGYGLVRVQWEGPWTEPGVPMRWRYRYTHWIGAEIRRGNVGVFDINCLNNGTGWCSLKDWSAVVVPFLVERYKRASGKWHITHALQVIV